MYEKISLRFSSLKVYHSGEMNSMKPTSSLLGKLTEDCKTLFLNRQSILTLQGYLDLVRQAPRPLMRNASAPSSAASTPRRPFIATSKAL
jgi:hypothetical protein